MSFVFASSHLPEVERPADEDEEEDVQPMRRSGGVRAFSHLPQTVRAASAGPRPSGPAPASRPAWAAAPDSPSGHESADGHDHEPDDDADDGHGSGADTGPHEPDDGRPWYLPRITAADLQPEGGEHEAPAKVNIGPVPRLSGGAGSFRPLPGHVEDDAENEHADAGSHVDFEPPATAGGGNQGAIGPSSPRGAAPPAGRSLFLTPRPMPPEYARQMATTYGAAPDNRGSSPELAARADTLAQAGAQQPGQGPVQSRDNSETPKQTPPAAPAPSPATNGTQKGASAGKATPSTTLRIGDYPGFNGNGYEPKEMDDWNQAFRNTYGTSAVNAARKNGVPARLLAALSANEMAAIDWTAFDAFADRNTLATKSVGPLQISSKTALRYKLVPVDNEFYGLPQSDIWAALHDPDLRYAGESSSHAPEAQHKAPERDLPAFTPSQNLLLRRTPYPTNLYDPNGTKIVHDYLDNPATGFDAGAKLLKVYLQRLVDDRQSGAYLKYSNDFLGLTHLATANSDIHKDLDTFASGDKDAIHNLHFGPGLAKAVAMMWNNGEDIVNVKDIGTQSPNASKHASNMMWQHDHQNDIIPATGSPQP